MSPKEPKDPKEPKEEHINEFIKALKEEFKKEKGPQDPRIAMMEERLLSKGRKIPPSVILARLEHINRRRRFGEDEETWIDLARTVFEHWEKENYPNEEPPTP
jgi:hypothetical protein